MYPILRADSFSVDADTLNGYIAKLNGLLPTIAAMHENVRVADTASVLRDSQNRLSPALADADGIHLLTPAYQRILLYLRTHAWL